MTFTGHIHAPQRMNSLHFGLYIGLPSAPQNGQNVSTNARFCMSLAFGICFPVTVSALISLSLGFWTLQSCFCLHAAHLDIVSRDDMLSAVSRVSASWSRSPSLSQLTIKTRKRSFQRRAPHPQRVTRAGVDHTHDVLEPGGTAARADTEFYYSSAETLEIREKTSLNVDPATRFNPPNSHLRPDLDSYSTLTQTKD